MLWEKIWFFRKCYVYIYFDLAIPHLDIYTIEMKAYVHTKICIQIYS